MPNKLAQIQIWNISKLTRLSERIRLDATKSTINCTAKHMWLKLFKLIIFCTHNCPVHKHYIGNGKTRTHPRNDIMHNNISS